MKGTWVFTHTAAAGWMKMGGAESPLVRVLLEELDMVELDMAERVAAADVIAARGRALRDQRDGAGPGGGHAGREILCGARGGALQTKAIGGAMCGVDT